MVWKNNGCHKGRELHGVEKQWLQQSVCCMPCYLPPPLWTHLPICGPDFGRRAYSPDPTLYSTSKQ